MARIDEHLDQWQHNREFLQTIQAEYSDWIVTGALYLSLHAIETLLTADRANPRSSHKDRLIILQSEQRYLKIYRPFRSLYDLAHVTRYSAQRSRWLPAGQVEQRVIRDLVYPIETSVRKLLAASRPPIIAPPHTPIRLQAGPAAAIGAEAVNKPPAPTSKQP